MKILVVEDEKMIRQGIVAMINRSEVEVEYIWDCKNGLEAMEVLRNNPVDVVFTDIRMPKMDGITLMNKMQELPFSPHVIIISGYEDFNYAVEAMKTGVEDYILKPIEREKINQVLKKFEGMLKEEGANQDKMKNVLCQQLKYVLINETISDSELKLIEDGFRTMTFFEGYRVFCTKSKNSQDYMGNMGNMGSFICLEDIDGQTVILVDDKELDGVLKELTPASCVGISQSYKKLEDLKLAYEEGKKARIEAFIKGRTIICEDTGRVEKSEKTSNIETVLNSNKTSNSNKTLNIETASNSNNTLKSERVTISEYYPEQFVQRLGTELFEKDMKKLEFYLFQAQHGKLDIDAWMHTVESILKLLFHTYGQLIEISIPECTKMTYPLQFNNAETYMEEFKAWLTQIKNQIADEFDDHYKRERINQAIEYIQQHYNSNLNMAVVSNHISMNYSLFSFSFKQYVGINFVNYLKNMRIKEAKRLLESTNEKIIDISRMVGYDNEKHFMKTFKSICGVSPSDYRKNIQLGQRSD